MCLIGLTCCLISTLNYAVSLRDKIGQMLIIGFKGTTLKPGHGIAKAIAENQLGGVILFNYDQRVQNDGYNIDNQAQIEKLTHDLQAANTASYHAHQAQALPLFIAVDAEGGTVNRLDKLTGTPLIPSAAEVGQKGQAYATQAANLLAKTLQKDGFNLNFAPVLDVNINPDNPIIGQRARSFSADAGQIAGFAARYTEQFRTHHLQCAYKHFPGHGSSSSDSHLGFVDVSNTWKPEELQPYQEVFNKPFPCGMVMTAHVVNRQLDASGKPATLSHVILTDILRTQLHFDGVIVTDDMQMKAISAHYGVKDAMVMAINAGADMLIFGNNLPTTTYEPAELINLIEQEVQLGHISPQRIDSAYKRIVALKQTL